MARVDSDIENSGRLVPLAFLHVLRHGKDDVWIVRVGFGDPQIQHENAGLLLHDMLGEQDVALDFVQILILGILCFRDLITGTRFNLLQLVVAVERHVHRGSSQRTNQRERDDSSAVLIPDLCIWTSSAALSAPCGVLHSSKSRSFTVPGVGVAVVPGMKPAPGTDSFHAKLLFTN